MKLDLILLDFDGTIADTFSETVNIFNRFAVKYGFNSVDAQDIERARSMNVFQLLKFVNIPKRKLPFLLRKGKGALYNNLHKVTVFEGIREMLELAEENSIKCGIITSNSIKNVERFIEINNLPNISIVRSSSKIFGKPREFKRVLKKLKIKKEAAIYIGDEARDIDAAKAFGMEILAVTWGYNSKSILTQYNPDYLINTPRELLSTIETKI